MVDVGICYNLFYIQGKHQTLSCWWTAGRQIVMQLIWQLIGVVPPCHVTSRYVRLVVCVCTQFNSKMEERRNGEEEERRGCRRDESKRRRKRGGPEDGNKDIFLQRRPFGNIVCFLVLRMRPWPRARKRENEHLQGNRISFLCNKYCD